MLIVLSPVALLVVNSLRTAPEVTAQSIGWPEVWQWGNYAKVIDGENYFQRLLNSTIITASSALLICITASLAAWAFVRHTRRWTKLIFNLFVVGLTIPFFVIVTPVYLLMRDLHLLDSFIGVILVYTGINLPFAVFFFTSFIKSIPAELEEAAAVDGAGVIRTYVSVILPLLRPAVATLAIFVSLNVWNDIILPLIFLTSESQSTVTLGIYQFVGTHSSNISTLFPAVVLGIAPLVVLFLILQRYIIAGITAGVGKG
jgi:raffinose/stachyose/melibiose transport system permease protein